MSLNSIKISLLAATLSACSFNTQAVDNSTPAIVTLPEVSDCSFISAIKVSSDYNKHVDWRSHSRHKVLLKAAKMRATHVVIQNVETTGAFNGSISANAYQCKG